MDKNRIIKIDRINKNSENKNIKNRIVKRKK